MKYFMGLQLNILLQFEDLAYEHNVSIIYITLGGFKIMPLRNRGIIVTNKGIYSTSIKKSK